MQKRVEFIFINAVCKLHTEITGGDSVFSRLQQCIAMILLDKLMGYITDRYFSLHLLISLCKLYPEASEDCVLFNCTAVHCLVTIRSSDELYTGKYVSLYNEH
jgi:hypothetical protein